MLKIFPRRFSLTLWTLSLSLSLSLSLNYRPLLFCFCFLSFSQQSYFHGSTNNKQVIATLAMEKAMQSFVCMLTNIHMIQLCIHFTLLEQINFGVPTSTWHLKRELTFSHILFLGPSKFPLNLLAFKEPNQISHSWDQAYGMIHQPTNCYNSHGVWEWKIQWCHCFNPLSRIPNLTSRTGLRMLVSGATAINASLL